MIIESNKYITNIYGFTHADRGQGKRKDGEETIPGTSMPTSMVIPACSG
jgi:hypothetical protein